MPPTSRALLLDLDGTIADTLPHVFDAFRFAVAPWVDRDLTDAEIEATFGPPERECIAKMAPPANLDEAVERFHSYHETHHATGVKLVDGIAGAIDLARALSWRVGVFTGKGRRTAEFALADLKLAERIELLISGSDVSRPKPDPEGVFRASEALGVPIGRILLVGDSVVDVQAGRAAGAKTAAALWAALRPDRLREAGADFVCERVVDLTAAIRALHAEV